MMKQQEKAVSALKRILDTAVLGGNEAKRAYFTWLTSIESRVPANDEAFESPGRRSKPKANRSGAKNYAKLRGKLSFLLKRCQSAAEGEIGRIAAWTLGFEGMATSTPGVKTLTPPQYTRNVQPPVRRFPSDLTGALVRCSGNGTCQQQRRK